MAKKNINDYKNKGSFYIHCKSQEEWDKISKLLGRTSIVSYKEINNNNNNVCIDINNPNSSWSLDFVTRNNFQLLEASDFLEDSSENLKVTYMETGNYYTDEDCFFKVTEKERGDGFRLSSNYYVENNRFGLDKDKLRLCNKDEITWIEACIKANKFIPKEEALKSNEKPKFTFEEIKKQAIEKFPINCKIQYLDGETNILKGHHFIFDFDKQILSANSNFYKQQIYNKGSWAINKSKLEFVDNEIYYCTKGGHQYIIRAKGINGGTFNYILVSTAQFQKDSSLGSYNWDSYDLASEDQKQWLINCEKLGYYISLEESKRTTVGKISYKAGNDPNNKNTLCYIKCFKINGNTLSYNDILTIKDKNYTKLNKYTYTFDNVRDLTLEEITHFEKCIEAGIWVEPEISPEVKSESKENMEEKWIAKKGDWVTITDKGPSIYNWHKGKDTFKVGYSSYNDSYDKNRYFVCEEDKDIGNGVFNEYFRKALPHEIPKENMNSTELGSLPRDWYIITTEENSLEVEQWKRDVKLDPKNYHRFFIIGAYIGFWEGKKDSSSKEPFNATEITFEQFKKWVLKETPKESHSDQIIDVMNDEKIPLYVKNISYFQKTIGKIYNTKLDKPEDSVNNWETILLEYNRLKDNSFKISTKEAYESQFNQQPKEVDNDEKWKVGGFIKITNHNGADNRYKNGDILKIGNWNLSYPECYDINGKRVLIDKSEATWLGMTNPEENKVNVNIPSEQLSSYTITNLGNQPITLDYDNGYWTAFENSNWIKPTMSPKKNKFNEQEFLNSSFNKELKLSKTNKKKVKQTIKF